MIAFPPIATLDDRILSIVLDWAGSLLMLGSLWGWMYSRLSPPIKRHLAQTERRLKAAARLLFGKYYHDQRMQRFHRYRERLGARKDMLPKERFFIVIAHIISLQKQSESDPEYVQEVQEIRQMNKGTRKMMPRLVCYLFLCFYYEICFVGVRVIDAVTSSLFTGKAGRLLFAIGFLMWNASKIISLKGG